MIYLGMLIVFVIHIVICAICDFSLKNNISSSIIPDQVSPTLDVAELYQ